MEPINWKAEVAAAAEKATKKTKKEIADTIGSLEAHACELIDGKVREIAAAAIGLDVSWSKWSIQKDTLLWAKCQEHCQAAVDQIHEAVKIEISDLTKSEMARILKAYRETLVESICSLVEDKAQEDANAAVAEFFGLAEVQ